MGARGSKADAAAPLDRVRGARVRICMLGLDASGKTTLAYRMNLGEITTVIPMIGMNIELAERDGVSFTVWDVGGRSQIRPLWRHFWQNSNGVIFVVDANDRARLDDAREELRRLFNEDDLRDLVFLVLSNKHELPNAMRADELRDALQLDAVPETVELRLYEISAVRLCQLPPPPP